MSTHDIKESLSVVSTGMDYQLKIRERTRATLYLFPVKLSCVVSPSSFALPSIRCQAPDRSDPRDIHIPILPAGIK